MNELEKENLELRLKFAAIREWVNSEYIDITYFEIVHGIRSVLDWSIKSQKHDSELVDLVRKFQDENPKST